jgi:hypothetical protein
MNLDTDVMEQEEIIDAWCALQYIRQKEQESQQKAF